MCIRLRLRSMAPSVEGMNARRRLAGAGLDLLEFGGVLGPRRATDEVPDRRIAPKVPLEVLMVLIVEGCSDEPPCRPGSVPPARQELVSRVNVQSHDDVGWA